MSRNVLFGLFSLLIIASFIIYDRVIDPDKPHSAKGDIELNSTDDTGSTTGQDQSEGSNFGFGSDGDQEPEVLEPVHWSVNVGPIVNDTVEAHFSAKIDDGWYVYSSTLDPDIGPVPTSITYLNEGDSTYSLIESIEESDHVKEGMDAIWQAKIKKFADNVVFVQRIALHDTFVTVKGYVEFMTCDNSRCLPPQDLDFELDLRTHQYWIGTKPVDTGNIDTSATGKFTFVKDLNNPVGNCGVVVDDDEEKGGKSLLSIFILGLLGGFVALLTPCVFPMIPLTVSFFTKGGSEKGKGMFNASMYGFFIFLIYVLLSVPFHLLDTVNPDILNDISTNIYLNLIFFVVFVVFAISFFGYFEIMIPSSFTNKVDSASDVGGFIGIFLMALTLALVSFSCTGPILGSLLAGALSADGGAWQLTSGMAGFGLALAMPFTLFAAFPSLLKSLPKSGGWLNSVKVVIAFAELALAAKFLSNADLVAHWGILKRETFFAIWILAGTGIVAYLLGWIKFPHDSPIKKLGLIRISTALLVLAFVVYLIPGLTNTKYANRKLMSGFPPPLFYSIYDKGSECPLGLNCFHDFEEGRAYAEKMGKPIFIDFTGWACVNCRRMEENVWVDKDVFEMLDKDYVVISLYVDDKNELPADEQVTVIQANGNGRVLRTVGNKWSFFQTHNFVANSQPYYVLIDANGTLLTKPVGYTPDAKQYADFLHCGLDAYSQIGE